MAISRLVSKLDGDKERAAKRRSKLILILAQARHVELERLLQRKGYLVVAPVTSDQAVAVCLHNRIPAAIIDQSFFAEGEAWTVAQSLKAVAPKITIVLLVRGSLNGQEVPPGVDCAISAGQPKQVLNKLQECVPH